MNNNFTHFKAELVKPDVALQSFRDGGYNFTDAVGEIVDNSIQAGARNIKFDWKIENVKRDKSSKSKREMTAIAIFDDGQGIPPNILPSVLTIGFSTRYNNRDGIGRFGVGFKLASISQARRLEIYTCPTYLDSDVSKDSSGKTSISYREKNVTKQIFKSYLDLGEILNGTQIEYKCEKIDNYPIDFQHLTDSSENGTLIIWKDIDRMNEDRAYSESIDEKISGLAFFLARTYRVFIDKGLKIYLPDKNRSLFAFHEPLEPYDPTFQLENKIAESLSEESMKGELVEEGQLNIGREIVRWRVFLTPKVTRMVRGGGGIAGPKSEHQFKRLHIPENQGKISFLRHDREISYTKVPYMIPLDLEDKAGSLDRHIGIEVLFNPSLDEYFQVKHIKRGVEPVKKLRDELKNALTKPVKAARTRIRKLWDEVSEAKREELFNEDISGGRERTEETAKFSNASMPVSRSGETITPDEENEIIIQAAQDAGITNKEDQAKFVEQVQEAPIKAIEVGWLGKGLLDIEHLNKTLLIKINKRHPFIKDIYTPLKEAKLKGISEMEPEYISELLRKGIEGIDLLFFAYAKAESMHPDPESVYLELREDWGKFAATYLKNHQDLDIA